MLGGIGAGKSHVARALVRLTRGGLVDADALASEALETAARDGRLARLLGADAVRANGSPHRAAIADAVFTDEAELRALEALLHPDVLARIQARLAQHRRGNDASLLVLDVPLLLETGLDRECTAVWFVETPEDLRHERAARRGLKPDDVRRREQRQISLPKKRERADFVVHNDRELAPQIREGLRALGIPLEATS